VGLRARNFCLGDATEFEVTSTDPIVSIAWDFGDGNTSTLETPTHIYAAAGTYPVNVTVTTASDTKTESKDITIYGVPTANLASNEEVCHVADTFPFDVTIKTAEILGIQDPNDFQVQYFLSPTDRDTNLNPIPTTEDFNLGTTTIYAKVTNRLNNSCFATTEFDILIKRTPDLLAVPDSTVCDDDGDGLFTFDLSDWDDLIAPAMTNVNVSYHATQVDADASANPLPYNYTNTNPTEIIYFRIENTTYPECYEVGNFQLGVIDQVIANTPTDLEYCDDNNDGQAVFDLTQTAMEIIGTQNPNSLNLTYHETQTDADSGANPLNTGSYLSTAYQNTIYIRVENASDTSCYASSFFNLNIYDSPIVPQVADWQVCDDNNDGLFLFDLSEKEIEILSGTTGTIVSFYTSQTDAETAQNGITGNYQNTSNHQNIYFRLENTNNAQCYSVSSFQLQVFDTPKANVASDVIICDTDETGRYYFDLSEKDDEILNGQDPLYYDVSYHSSENDALNNVSPLPKADYQNTILNETIWVRVQHIDLESCFDVSSFNLDINPLPQMNMEDRYVICPDSPDLVIDGGSFESYSWRDGNGIEIGTQATLDITNLGNYSLTVTQTTNGVTCENTANFEVVSSGAPETLEVDLNGFSDEVQLELLATGTGEFEYSIDGENYQSSGGFRVFPGQYTVFVRDIYECRTLIQEVTAIGYQKFFTPNGDTIHDYWNVIGGENFPESRLTIYDRYGKFLTQIEPSSRGWDGTFNGKSLPSSDYWFRYEYDGGKIFKGHFTLKR